MASKTLKSSVGGTYTLSVTFSEKSYSIENNTSKIYISASLKSNQYSSFGSPGGTLYIDWYDNKTGWQTAKSKKTISSLGTSATGSTTAEFDVIHNDDGTLSGYARARWVRGSNTAAPVSGDVSTADTALTTLPRASTIKSIEEDNDFYLGSDLYPSLKIINNINSLSFTNKLTMEYNGTEYVLFDGVSDLSEVNLFLNQGYYETYKDDKKNSVYKINYSDIITELSNSFKLKFTLTTYNNGVQIGSSSIMEFEKIFKCSPIIFSPDFGCDEATYRITENRKVFIKNFSKLMVRFDISEYNNRVINKYYVSNMVDVKESTSRVINTNFKINPSQPIKIWMIDSAGMETETYITSLDDSQYLDYNEPIIKEVKGKRQESTATTCNIGCNGTFTNARIGNLDNTIKSLKYKYKKGTDSDYSDWVDVTSDVTIENNNFTYNGELENIPTTTTCEVLFNVTDSLNETYELSGVILKNSHFVEYGNFQEDNESIGYFNINGEINMNDYPVPSFNYIEDEKIEKTDEEKMIDLYDYKGNKLVINQPMFGYIQMKIINDIQNTTNANNFSLFAHDNIETQVLGEKISLHHQYVMVEQNYFETEGIKIGKGVEYLRVTLSARLNNRTTSNRTGIIRLGKVKKDGSVEVEIVGAAYSIPGGLWENPMLEYTIPVEEDDFIFGFFYKSQTNQPSDIYITRQATYMAAEVLGYNTIHKSESGGSGGTDNYNDLKNLPRINGFLISNSKNGENYNLQNKLIAGNNVTLTDDLGEHKTTIDVNIDISGKQDKLKAGENITIDENNVISASGGSGGTNDYQDLTNKPTINGVELNGNKSTDDLGIEIPTKTSELTNDSNFITSSDYATTTGQPGIVNLGGGSTYGYGFTTIGRILAVKSRTYAQLNNELDGYAISKKTLFNVLEAGDYASKSDIPDVPTKTSELENDSNFISEIPVASATQLGGIKVGGGLSITNGVLSATGGGTADSVEWNNVLNKPDFKAVATSGSYNDLSDKPTIPSQITIDSALSSTSTNPVQNKVINTALGNKVDKVSGKGLSTNDLTATLKSHYDTAYTNNHTHSNKSVLDGITSAKITEWNGKSTFSGNYNDLTNKPTIPTNSSIVDLIYPVGSIYLSMNATNPGTLFGGTWEALPSKFLVGVGELKGEDATSSRTLSVGDTGGYLAHTLTIDEMPTHNHGNPTTTLTGSVWNLVGQDANYGPGNSNNGIFSAGGDASYSYPSSKGSSSKGRDGFSINATHTHEDVGGGNGFETLPPYLAVYMWKRKA